MKFENHQKNKIQKRTTTAAAVAAAAEEEEDEVCVAMSRIEKLNKK